ncbi:MAG: hypothetical protein RXQ62_03465 [Nitrososphaeria archaeon]
MDTASRGSAPEEALSRSPLAESVRSILSADSRSTNATSIASLPALAPSGRDPASGSISTSTRT